MACPTGWTTEKLIELPNPGIKNAMYFRSNNSSGIHIFSVEQYITRPSLRFDRYNQKEEWTKDNVTFQDHIATRYRFYSPGVVFDSKSQCGVYFVFENHDLWYKIGYRNYGFGNSIPDAVIDILDSFEVNCPCPELLSSVPKPKTGVLVQEF
ncbi:hypothetical protein FACS189427_08260 [Planctomycetales bacterium]|nr:hypothetical protein FACS189427_08260 [Planctomycetales bacterium]